MPVASSAPCGPGGCAGPPKSGSRDATDPIFTRRDAATLTAHTLDVDPTNDQFVNDRYVTVAWGRDYADVPPLKGVVYTEAKVQDLTVTVDVETIADDDPALAQDRHDQSHVPRSSNMLLARVSG